MTPAKPATVVLAKGATVAETTAAEEVVHYLGQVTGAKLSVVTEGAAGATGGRIYVGPSAVAAALGIDAAKLGAEEWIVRSRGRDLVLVGGRPRGTLYAAYHFLEDVVGVHWWSPWEESVPKRRSLSIGALDLHGKPAFAYRDIYMLYGHDSGRFAARNRLNREGDAPIASKYGGSLDYGPPYHVHTAFAYFPPSVHFAQHPEWYSLIGGKRTAENAQLCWTNPELRQAFLAKLLSTIESSRAAALAAKLPPPLVYSISQNDCENPCQCDRCQAIATAEGSEAGPLLDFVNAMADAVKERYPDVFIDTLAYQYTQKAPKTIQPRDNVIIRLCDTEADMIRPITAPENRAFREHIRSWARIARNLRVWDYAVTYGSPIGMPLPTAHTFGPDYRFYAANHVEGVFTELEYEVLADLRDFKVWAMMKTLENPAADYEKLTDTFMNGCYGPAGKLVKRYVRDLEAEAVRCKSHTTCWQGSPTQLTYLNSGFVTRAEALFDQGERAVKGDAVRTQRVRFARLSLDRAVLAAYPKLVAEWQRGGGDAARFPLVRAAVARRALGTWRAEIERRIPAGQREAELLTAEGEIQRYAMLPDGLRLPAKFQGYPRGTVYDYTAVMTRNYGGIAKVVKDPEAESGVTNRLELTAADVEHPERYVLPMPWGVYDTASKETQPGAPVRAEDVAAPGYEWYKMGTLTITPNSYVWFFWSWIIQLDVGNVLDGSQPGDRFEVWARVKFEGPRFPHAKAGDKDAICVERIVLVRVK